MSISHSISTLPMIPRCVAHGNTWNNEQFSGMWYLEDFRDRLDAERFMAIRTSMDAQRLCNARHE